MNEQTENEKQIGKQNEKQK
jgi:hypothetical protein